MFSGMVLYHSANILRCILLCVLVGWDGFFLLVCCFYFVVLGSPSLWGCRDLVVCWFVLLLGYGFKVFGLGCYFLGDDVFGGMACRMFLWVWLRLRFFVQDWVGFARCFRHEGLSCGVKRNYVRFFVVGGCVWRWLGVVLWGGRAWSSVSAVLLECGLFVVVGGFFGIEDWCVLFVVFGLCSGAGLAVCFFVCRVLFCYGAVSRLFIEVDSCFRGV